MQHILNIHYINIKNVKFEMCFGGSGFEKKNETNI